MWERVSDTRTGDSRRVGWYVTIDETFVCGESGQINSRHRDRVSIPSQTMAQGMKDLSVGGYLRPGTPKMLLLLLSRQAKPTKPNKHTITPQTKPRQRIFDHTAKRHGNRTPTPTPARCARAPHRLLPIHQKNDDDSVRFDSIRSKIGSLLSNGSYRSIDRSLLDLCFDESFLSSTTPAPPASTQPSRCV